MKLKKKTTRPANRTAPHFIKSLSVPVEPREVAAPKTSFLAEPEASSVVPAATGVVVGVGEGDGEGDGLGELVGLGVGVGDGDAVGVGVGDTIGEGDGDCETAEPGLAEGDGLGSTAKTEFAPMNKTKYKKRNTLNKKGRKFILIID